MITEFKPYPVMKPSNVEWLGAVPEHWEARRLKTILADRVTDGPHLTPTFVASGVPFLSVDGIQSGELVFEDCRYVSLEDHVEFSKKAVPRRGDLLLGKAASTGKLARVKVDFEFSIWSPLALIRPDQSQVLSEFLEYALKDVSAQVQIEMLCTLNTQKNIGMADIPRLIVALPPLDEQAAIVRYLDHADRRISRYIRAKQRLIELLEEEKQVIIHRAVTRGLDPDVRLKPSGVEWLGDVPEHWEVARLGSLLHERGETNRDGAVTHVLSLLRHRGVIPYDQKGRIGNKKSEDITRYKVVRPDDIVMNCMNVIIGSVGLSSYTGCLSPVYYILVARHGNNPRYLDAIFQVPTFHRSLIKIGNGILAHRMRIPMELLKCELLPRPPAEEQMAIVRHLDHASANIDTTIGRALREIELLREYRTRLIADVVTGKLDVREAAAALPEVDPADLEDTIEIDDVEADELALELEEVAT